MNWSNCVRRTETAQDQVWAKMAPGEQMEVAMQYAKRWYERKWRPYREDRNKVEEYANWLKQVNWRLFCTFTFAWRVSDQQAKKTFADFINRLEKHLKCDVGYVRGD